MREGCMAPMVLAVTPAKGLKALSKSNADVKDFAKRVELPKERFPLWPAGVGGKGAADLAALCESQSLFYDLFGDARVQQIIGKDPHLQKHLRWGAQPRGARAARAMRRRVWLCARVSPDSTVHTARAAARKARPNKRAGTPCAAAPSRPTGRSCFRRRAASARLIASSSSQWPCRRPARWTSCAGSWCAAPRTPAIPFRGLAAG